jgi:hypothetical protein
VKAGFCLNLNNLHKEEHFLFLSIRNNVIIEKTAYILVPITGGAFA